MKWSPAPWQRLIGWLKRNFYWNTNFSNLTNFHFLISPKKEMILKSSKSSNFFFSSKAILIIWEISFQVSNWDLAFFNWAHLHCIYYITQSFCMMITCSSSFQDCCRFYLIFPSRICRGRSEAFLILIVPSDYLTGEEFML